MGTVHQLQEKTIDEMVSEVHRQFGISQESEQKSHRSRIKAGELLNQLRGRIEAGEVGEGVKWWKWCKNHVARSKRDCQKAMKLASSPDPEAAHDKEKEDAREGMRRGRASNVRHQSGVEEEPDDQGELVATILRLVEQLDGDFRQQLFAELRSKYAQDQQDGKCYGKVEC